MFERTIGYTYQSPCPTCPYDLKELGIERLITRDLSFVDDVPPFPEGFHGCYQYCFDSLAEMKAHLNGHDDPNRICMQVTAFNTDRLVDYYRDRQVLFSWQIKHITVEPLIKENLLGLDVCDPHGMSGIYNMGGLDKSTPLNMYGLIDRLTVATAFAKATDERAPEHAPFFVCGLYELKL